MKEAFHVGDGTLQLVWKKIRNKRRPHNSLVSFIFQGVIGQLHDDAILLQLPESLSLFFSCAN